VAAGRPTTAHTHACRHLHTRATGAARTTRDLAVNVTSISGAALPFSNRHFAEQCLPLLPPLPALPCTAYPLPHTPSHTHTYHTPFLHLTHTSYLLCPAHCCPPPAPLPHAITCLPTFGSSYAHATPHLALSKARPAARTPTRCRTHAAHPATTRAHHTAHRAGMPRSDSATHSSCRWWALPGGPQDCGVTIASGYVSGSPARLVCNMYS